jgi:hypothetical protein
VFKKECEVCGCGITSLLEVHHIRPQKDANNKGFFEDGSHKNARENLIVVCQKCHDKHHNSEIRIGKVKKTSDGEEREIQVLEVKEKPKSKKIKWSEEEQKTILQTIQEKPNATAEYIKSKLQELSIQITVNQIRKLRSQLTENSQ